jgi:type I restriction enzyme S subunit
VGTLEQTILQLAVRGLLVPQDSTDESASVLLQKIRTEKDRLIAQGKIKRDKPLPPITDEEKPFELPRGWEWVSLGLLTSLVTSGSRSWKDFYSAEGATFIRSQDIKYDRLEFDERAYVKLPIGREGVRTQVRRHDVLITITGANVGKAAVVAQSMDEAYVSQHVALVRLCDARLVDFLHLWLVSGDEGRKRLLMSSYGAKPGLNLQNISDLLVPLPPLAEQIRIVTLVNEKRALCDHLRRCLNMIRFVQAKVGENLIAST